MTYKTDTTLVTIALTFAIALLSMSTESCAADKSEAAQLQIDSLFTRTIPAQKRVCIYSLHAMAKDAIPTLINTIDTNKILPLLGLKKPQSSFLLIGGHRNQYAGILAAYMVDMIVQRDSLTPPDSIVGGYLLFRDDYIYEQGLLVVDDSLSPSLEQMIEVAKLYSAWWDRNEDKTLVEIRKANEDGKHPLANSRYSWK